MTIDEPLGERPEQSLMPDDPAVKEYLVKLLTLGPSEIDRLDDVWNAYQQYLAKLLEKKVALQPEDTHPLLVESMNKVGVQSGRHLLEQELPKDQPLPDEPSA